VDYSIIKELRTSSTRNAHVLTLFESSRKMVQDLAEIVETWMKRSAVDIQAFEGQGYDYGLRMFTAFARVVGQCFQAYENTMSEEVHDQKKQAESLREWNRIALHRCRCEACLHLKQINKHHLASLPLWLCEEYALGQHEIDSLPHFVRDRRKSLMQLFSNDAYKPSANKTIELYQAPLFCFWPHCRDYEIEKIEVTPEKGDQINGEYRNYVKQKLLTRSAKINGAKIDGTKIDDRYEFIVSIHFHGDDVATATKFDVIIMRPSKEAENRHRDLRWIQIEPPVSVNPPVSADPPVSVDHVSVQMPIPKSDSEEFQYLRYLKGLIKGSESTRFNASARVKIILASAATTCITFSDVNFDSFLDSCGNGSDVGFGFDYYPDSRDEKAKSILKQKELKVAVAFAQADQVWQMNKLLLLLDLIKRNRQQKSTGFDLSFFQEKPPSAPLKYNYLVQKFLHFEAPNVSESIDTTKWKLGCVECLRDQSIAFMSDLQKQNAQSDNTNIASGPLEHEVALNRHRYEACQDTIAHFMDKIKIVYTTLGVSTPGDEKPGTANTGSATTDTASTTVNDAAAAVVAAHDGAGIGQAADSKSTVKFQTNSEKKTKQSVKRILDPNIEIAILQR
jgi:hypothetical protein